MKTVKMKGLLIPMCMWRISMAYYPSHFRENAHLSLTSQICSCSHLPISLPISMAQCAPVTHLHTPSHTLMCHITLSHNALAVIHIKFSHYTFLNFSPLHLTRSWWCHPGITNKIVFVSNVTKVTKTSLL